MIAPRSPLTVRVYRALLVLLLPAGFNDAFADDMLALFCELDRVARTRNGRIAALGKKQLEEQRAAWDRVSVAISTVLNAAE